MAAPSVTVTITLNGSPNDVTSYVDTREPVTVRRGRGGVFDNSTVGTASFTLNNETGYFTPSAANPYSLVEILPNVPVTIAVDSVTVFTGYIDEWTATVGEDGRARCQVTALDNCAVLDGFTLGSYGVERQHYIAGGVTYPLGSANGADTSASYSAWRNTAASDLYVDAGNGGSYEFTSDGPPFMDGALTLKPDSTTEGPWVEHPTSFNPGTGGTLIAWFKCDQTSGTYYIAAMVRSGSSTPYLHLYLDGGTPKAAIARDSGGGVTITSSKTTCNDGDWHMVALQTDGTGTAAFLTVDGTVVNSASTGSALTISSTNRHLYFGSFANSVGVGAYGFNGSIAGITCTTTVVATAALEQIYRAGRWGEAYDTIDDRVYYLMEAAYPSGPYTCTVVNDDSIQLMGQQTSGKSLFQALADVADTERGVVYAQGNGDVYLRGVNARSSATVVATIDALGDLAGDLTVSSSNALFANRVEATSPAGFAAVEDTASIAAIDRTVTDRWECLAYLLTTAANDRLDVRVAATPRVERVKVDLMTCTTSGLVADVLGLNLLDRVSLVSLPAPPLVASTQDGIVEGWELQASMTDYTVTLDLSPVE